MRFSPSRIGATAILVLFAGAGAGCTLVNKIRAKNELNETARSYREGRFEEAEQHAKRALYLDPSNPTAPIFIARVIHQQYKPGVDQPDNIQRAREAIAAYQWILARAHDPNMSSEKRAEAYAILAGKDWDCSFKVTELPDVKFTSTEGGN